MSEFVKYPKAGLANAISTGLRWGCGGGGRHRPSEPTGVLVAVSAPGRQPQNGRAETSRAGAGCKPPCIVRALPAKAMASSIVDSLAGLIDADLFEGDLVAAPLRAKAEAAADEADDDGNDAEADDEHGEEESAEGDEEQELRDEEQQPPAAPRRQQQRAEAEREARPRSASSRLAAKTRAAPSNHFGVADAAWGRDHDEDDTQDAATEAGAGVSGQEGSGR